MRIVADASSCAKPKRGGIGSYGWNLLSAMAAQAPDHEYVLGLRPNRWRRRHLVDDLLPGRPRCLLGDPLPPWNLGAPDVFHGLGVRLPRTRAFPKVVTLHDINVFEFPELANPKWRDTRQAKIRETLARADRVITLARDGARGLHELLGVPWEILRPILLAVDTNVFRPRPVEEVEAVTARLGLAGRPYVLMLGPYGRRKNQEGLLAAFARADLDPEWLLVLGGPRGADADTLRVRAAELELPDDRLVLPGWIDDADLPGLYAGAAFYACASMHEGFGFPVLEAQACGTAVISSDRGSLPEALGECGVTFDATDLDAFAGAIHLMAREEGLRAQLRIDGPKRVAAGFTWDRVAAETLAVYAEFADGHATAP